ncbi:hypothetical protein SRRS_52120 [Sporomusa rhizae]|uniref:TldD/PmbA family protein n=1 Tax=Sporomusa rhizae TaxID=357999 RepID=UPI00352A336D
MKVAMSKFLNDHKPVLEELLTLLQEHFQYVSILGTDCAGKLYSVQKNGVSVNDSRWTERGFVVRVYNGINYSEFSFNEIKAETLGELVQKICHAVKDTIKTLTDAAVSFSKYDLIDEKTITDSYSGEVKIFPGELSTEQKLAKMTAIKEKALASSELLVDFQVRYEEVSVSKVFISSKKKLEQAYIWSQGYLVSIVRRDNNTKYCHKAFSGLQSAELLDEMAAAIDTVIDTSSKLLDAQPVEPGEYDVICSPDVAGLIAHEAFGHGVEMDMFVKGRAKAVEYINKPVASELVTMHDGAASASHVSSFLFDDEGVLGTDTIIINKGILQTGICDTLAAQKLSIAPTGNGKRESFERKAYTRMTNTFFAQGNDKLDDMIASIKSGYLIDHSMSGMEDPKSWGIQCMVLQGEEIVEGRLTGKIVSPIIMTGYVPDLLKSISMVSDIVELSGSGACGKGYKEWVKVSSGGPYIKAKARLG